MHHVSCTNTHHGVTNLVKHLNIKTKILNLCLRFRETIVLWWRWPLECISSSSISSTSNNLLINFLLKSFPVGILLQPYYRINSTISKLKVIKIVLVNVLLHLVAIINRWPYRWLPTMVFPGGMGEVPQLAENLLLTPHHGKITLNKFLSHPKFLFNP